RRYLEGSTFITMNADTIVNVDLATLAAAHLASGAFATMLLRKDPRMAVFGIIETEGDGRVGRFLGLARPGCHEPLEPYMYTGVQVLGSGVFEYLAQPGPFSITKVSYPAMLRDERLVRAEVFTGDWITVGTASELAEAELLLANSRPGSRWTTQSVES
ncbi:MAG: NDP-sugar synthase, partial [Candidatus Binatia bacterium]